MKIATWNVNSIRARLERLLAYLSTSQPDVLCLQELKCTDDVFPTLELSAAGYQSAAWGQKTYNGVAILSRQPLEDVRRGLMDGGDDTQARLISAMVGGVRVMSLYAPNGQEVDSPAYQYKLAYYQRLAVHLRNADLTCPLVLCGDFNVAPEPMDVHDPAAWEGQTLFTMRERQALQELKAVGLVDTFRQHHPEGGRFSWWDYRMLAFPKNRGLRIDYILASNSFAQRCIASDIDREFRKGKQPSDHAPVWSDFT